MDTTLLQSLRELLEQERSVVQTELGSLAHVDKGNHTPGDYNPTFPNYGDDALGDNSESPAEVADYALNVDVTGRLEQRLEEIEQALKRMDAGTYGTCLHCGQIIAQERLQANPSAARCVACASA